MTEENKNELTVFEEIRRDLTIVNTPKVPLSMVFGRGSMGDQESFGGQSLLQNTVKVDYALQNVSELQTIWNHSHTQWTWRHINLSWLSPYNNMRQIAAEIQNKKTALNEAKWRRIDLEIDIREMEDKLNKGLENNSLDYWEEVKLKVKLAKAKEGLHDGITYIEGAMKDILSLSEFYEQLKSKLSSFSEADYEKEETKNHLKRALVQCIRDVRMTGCISKGEQEYIEQIGVNPTKLQSLLREYVVRENKEESWDVSGLYDFVNNLTDELVDSHKVDQKRMELQGFKSNILEDFTQMEKLALPKK